MGEGGVGGSKRLGEGITVLRKLIKMLCFVVGKPGVDE